MFPTYWEFGVAFPTDCYVCGQCPANWELRDYEGHVETRACEGCKAQLERQIFWSSADVNRDRIATPATGLLQ